MFEDDVKKVLSRRGEGNGDGGVVRFAVFAVFFICVYCDRYADGGCTDSLAATPTRSLIHPPTFCIAPL